MEGFAALDDEGDAQKALRKFKKAHQEVSGRAGTALDEMIMALEESDVVSRVHCSRCRPKKAEQTLDYDEKEALRKAYSVVETYDDIFSDKQWKAMENILDAAGIDQKY